MFNLGIIASQITSAPATYQWIFLEENSSVINAWDVFVYNTDYVWDESMATALAALNTLYPPSATYVNLYAYVEGNSNEDLYYYFICEEE